MKIKELRKICQYREGQNLLKIRKPSKDKITITPIEVIFRYFSIYVIWLIIQINNRIGNKIKANHISFFMVIINLFACFLLATGNIKLMLLGCLFLLLGIFADYFDGEIARYYKDITLLGMQIDQINHKLTSRLFFFSLAFAVYLNTGFIFILPLGFLGAVLSHSIVSESMTHTLVHGILWEIRTKSKFNIETNERLGKLGWYEKTFINKALKYLRYFYIDPYDKLVYIILIIIGAITGKVFYLLLVAVTLYSLTFIVLQSSSMFYMLKEKNINKFYNTLFEGKKKKKTRLFQ